MVGIFPLLDFEVKITNINTRWEIATAGVRSGIVICPATTLLVDKDIEFRVNKSGASVFLGDTVAVQKLLKIRKNCPSIKHVFQLDGKAQDGVVLLSEALRSIPENARYTGPKPDIKHPSIIYFTSGEFPSSIRKRKKAYVVARYHWTS